MRQLRDDTHLVLDGEVRVYRRERSKRWQASFVIDGHTIRISTGKRDLTEAKEYPPSCLLQHHCVLINTCETKTLENWMSIRLLEHMRDELIATGIVQNTPEFCRSWLGRSEGYIRVLRYHNTEPSVETLSICASKLGYYAARLAASNQQDHQAWGERLGKLKALCDKAIAKQSEAVWRAPERMAV